ncbi:MAG: M48 family metallopeptidase [Bacteroidota bacterium]
MKNLIKSGILIFFFMIPGTLTFHSCKTVPISGRKQVNLLPEGLLRDMSYSTYNDFLKNNKQANDTEAISMVKNVGYNISNAVIRYMTKNGYEDRIDNFKWEFNLIQDELVNAWAMPGGKVAVYTGILPVTETPEGLAVVMAHEIAHVIARHGNERMSQQLAVQLGGIALSVAIKEKPEKTRELFLAAYGVTTAVGVILPYSRKHETEADKLGLIFMAMAGYDPRIAVDFWKRMAKQGEGEKPPEILSTHPPYEKRIKNIEKYMNTALKYYKKN